MHVLISLTMYHNIETTHWNKPMINISMANYTYWLLERLSIDCRMSSFISFCFPLLSSVISQTYPKFPAFAIPEQDARSFINAGITSHTKIFLICLPGQSIARFPALGTGACLWSVLWLAHSCVCRTLVVLWQSTEKPLYTIETICWRTTLTSWLQNCQL